MKKRGLSFIQIDGNYHNHEDVYFKDVKRQQELEEYNLNFLRFTEKEMKSQLLNVLRAIEIYIEEFEIKRNELIIESEVK